VLVIRLWDESNKPQDVDFCTHYLKFIILYVRRILKVNYVVATIISHRGVCYFVFFENTEESMSLSSEDIKELIDRGRVRIVDGFSDELCSWFEVFNEFYSCLKRVQQQIREIEERLRVIERNLDSIFP